jgi:hypothetical protein
VLLAISRARAAAFNNASRRLYGWGAERNMVEGLLLGRMGWLSPGPLFEIKLRPFGIKHFASPSPCQEQEPDDVGHCLILVVSQGHDQRGEFITA